jgi:hypothetical protein
MQDFDSILGVTNYQSDEFWHIEESESTISIVPIGNGRTVAVFGGAMFLCMVTVFVPIVLLTKDKVPGPLFVAGFFAGSMLVGLVTYGLWYNISLGPWLKINRGTREVEFPRLHRRCNVDDIVAWQIVTGRTGTIDVTELNAIVNAADGEFARWAIIGGYYTRTEIAIRELAQTLQETTGIPVRSPLAGSQG